MTREELDKLVEQVEIDHILMLWYDKSFRSVHEDSKGRKTIYFNEMLTCPYKRFSYHNIDKITNYGFVTFEEWNKKRRELILKHLKEMLKDPKSNASLLKEELKNMKGKICCDKHSHDVYGLFVDIVSTDEDYYYVLLGPNEKLNYISCVGSIEQVSEEYKEEMLPIIEWLKADEEGLYKYVQERLGLGEVSFSSLFLKP